MTFPNPPAPPTEDVCREMVLRYAQSLREYRRASLTSLARPARDTQMIRGLFDVIECDPDSGTSKLAEVGRMVERNLSPKRVERIRNSRTVDAEDELAARMMLASYLPVITSNVFASFDTAQYLQYARREYIPSLMQSHTVMMVSAAIIGAAIPRLAPMRFGLGVLAGASIHSAMTRGPPKT